MEIDGAIQKTIEYAGKFGMKLNKEQLWLRLMGPRVFSREEFDKRIAKTKLTGQKIANSDIEKKLTIAKKMIEGVTKSDKNILMAAVTGSVAAENCQKSDDIDILIVTRENRLWWCRLRLLFFLMKNKYKFRRHGKKEERNEFCFNMWMEERSLKIPREKQNERSAVDLILLKVLTDRDGVYDKFLRENDWAKKWVATGYSLKSKSRKSQSLKIGKSNKNIIEDIVNLIAFAGQYLYMLPKKTKEIINLKAAFFHIT